MATEKKTMAQMLGEVENLRSLFYWIGAGYTIGYFGGEVGYALTDPRLGGARQRIPIHLLDELERRKLVTTTPNGPAKNYYLTLELKRRAAAVQHNLRLPGDLDPVETP